MGMEWFVRSLTTQPLLWKTTPELCPHWQHYSQSLKVYLRLADTLKGPPLSHCGAMPIIIIRRSRWV
eukprot:2332495-Karenia_brevis.AAC.1